jgi:hypothetical protein
MTDDNHLIGLLGVNGIVDAGGQVGSGHLVGLSPIVTEDINGRLESAEFCPGQKTRERAVE